MDILLDKKLPFLYCVGDSVNLKIKKRAGYKALIIAFVLPLLLLLMALLIVAMNTNDMLLQSVIPIVVVLFYYVVLYIYRQKLNNQFEIEVSKE